MSMRAVRLDDETADRMLAGGVGPADAPPGYADVAELLERARSAAGLPVPVVSSARLGLVDPVPAVPVRRARSGRRIPVLAAVAFCAMTGGAYAAGAAGAGTGTVSAVLDRIGVGSLVGASSGHHAASPGTSALKGEASAEATGAAAAAPVAAGSDTPDAAPRRHRRVNEHGVAVSTAASDGKSHAGEHGNGTGTHRAPPAQPAHPAHPSHPRHPAHPTHPAHPGHPSHPSQHSGGNGGGSNKPGS
jgi:pyruvate/2-oxoglutarate dehydrogenase complex dihydrolipoamide acyltransferase (E2) component